MHSIGVTGGLKFLSEIFTKPNRTICLCNSRMIIDTRNNWNLASYRELHQLPVFWRNCIFRALQLLKIIQGSRKSMRGNKTQS